MEENQIHIPEGWKLTSFGEKDLFRIIGSGIKHFYAEKEYYSTSSIDGNKVLFAEQLITYRNRPSRANMQPIENSVWFAKMKNTFKILKATKREIEEVILSTGFCGIESTIVDCDYLMQILSSAEFNSQKNLLAEGSTQEAVNNTKIKEIKFLLPENPKEQTQIATILSKVDEAITQTEQLIAKYTRIKTGLMQDLLTKGIDEHGNIRSEETHEFKDSPLGRIPKEWECVNFGEYIELVHGYQFRNYDFTETGTQVVKIGQVKENGLDLSQCSFINPNRAQLFAKQTINNGDVLMALTGATLGKACIVSGLNNPVMQNYRVGRFEPIFINDVDKTFLFYTLKSSLFLGQIFNNVNEAAQGNVGKSDFKKSFFIKPPFEEQLKIVQHIEKIFNLVDDFNLELNKYQSLKTGLMQDLLSGKVRVNHLIKETASV